MAETIAVCSGTGMPATTASRRAEAAARSGESAGRCGGPMPAAAMASAIATAIARLTLGIGWKLSVNSS
jgi:hypothetical protein